MSQRQDKKLRKMFKNMNFNFLSIYATTINGLSLKSRIILIWRILRKKM